MRAFSDRQISALLEYQLGRPPRTPYRVAASCKYGCPQLIASPSRFDDGSLNPQWVWLTCPFLRKAIGQYEDVGGCAEARTLLEDRSSYAQQITRLDAEISQLRAAESGGVDEAADTGLAGSRDPLKVKCVHAHAAYYLAGLQDPIGAEYFKSHSKTCANRRCLKAVPPALGDTDTLSTDAFAAPDKQIGTKQK